MDITEDTGGEPRVFGISFVCTFFRFFSVEKDSVRLPSVLWNRFYLSLGFACVVFLERHGMMRRYRRQYQQKQVPRLF
ncbi:hypothetical protein RvY_06782-1 [Ramazzottius varieornatus]|uniref:Uncharacterized protein n=1 Tax=Ramazzottius varieornatus TaxID=947166 RepID=A0A1D1UZT0_RAMVA|nr:hypothetical protein RvY_06782-1 [Ramazzottius varieornatus]